MKKFIFSAFALCTLAFASCSKDDNGPKEQGGYNFKNSHLSFEYNLTGDVASLVEVIPSTTLPTDAGMASVSSDGTKHSIFISNIKCPAEFEVVYTLIPKRTANIEENKNYSYKADYTFLVVRNFDDDSHVNGDSGSETLTGVMPGKSAAEFFEINGTQTFKFKLSADGFLEEISEE